MSAKQIPRKFPDKRAVSNVISAVVMTGVVIALGLATLAWTQSRASDYSREYGRLIEADIARLKERLAIEYVFYNETSQEVVVYILNCGTIDGVQIQSAHIKNSTWNEVFPEPSLQFLNGNGDEDLDIGEEGYIVLSLSHTTLTASVYYYVRVVTARGAVFDSGLVA